MPQAVHTDCISDFKLGEVNQTVFFYFFPTFQNFFFYFLTSHITYAAYFQKNIISGKSMSEESTF